MIASTSSCRVVIATALASVPALVSHAAPPPVPAAFTPDEVSRLVRDTAVGGNAALLKAPYFLSRRPHPCSRAEGLWIISEALAEESQGTRRWVLLKSIYAFGCLRTGPTFRRDGFRAYNELFTAQLAQCDPDVSAEVCVAMNDCLRAIGSRRVRARALSDDTVEVLGLVARLYLTRPDLGHVELDFAPAVSRLRQVGGREVLDAAARTALADDDKHSYWKLTRAALVYKPWRPEKALALLQSAEDKLLQGDAKEAQRFYDHMIDILVATKQRGQAVVVAERLTRLTGRGGARLALLRDSTDSGAALERWIDHVDYTKVSGKELDEAAMMLRQAGQTAAMETVLSRYLGAERTRDLGYELWARYRLGCLLLTRKAIPEARKVLLGDHLDRQPQTSRANMYRRRIQQLIRQVELSPAREEAPSPCTRAQDARRNDAPLLLWKPGTWWVTETHVLRNTSRIRTVEQMDDFPYYHKWEVSGKVELDGEPCWAIDIYAIRLPPDVTNDHGNARLARLYLREFTLSLKRYEGSLRAGNYSVTGPKVRRPVIDFPRVQPVAGLSLQGDCPADVPLLPRSWAVRHLPAHARLRRLTDVRSRLPLTQHIELFSQDDTKRAKPAMLVSLRLHVETCRLRTMIWEKGRPWWSEWRQHYDDGRRRGMWYSRMIEWGGLAKEGEPRDGN